MGGVKGFSKRVLEECRKVKYGETISYGRLAKRAGSARAAQAVGQVLSANRLPLVIACHRVICADGRVGGFSAGRGVAMKKRMLAMEKRQ